MEHMELVQYFYDVAYHSLVTLGSNTRIQDVLMHMALAHDTVSGQALLSALLAFSSLRRAGLHHETMQFKVTALQALSTSSQEVAQGLAGAAQHVAAYIASIKKLRRLVLVYSRSDGHHARNPPRPAIGWQRDWRSTGLGMLPQRNLSIRHISIAIKTAAYNTETTPFDHPGGQYRALLKDRPASRSSKHLQAMLVLFSEICDTLLDPRDLRSRDEGHTSRLRTLEWIVRNFPASSSTSTALARPTTDLPFAVELYQTVTLIYLARASQTPWEPLAKLESIIDRAFDGPAHPGSCV
ncbi:zinc-finger transcription factor [Seiridium cupressi]